MIACTHIMPLLLLALLLLLAEAEGAPSVVTRGDQFVESSSGAPVLLIGANVVLKGPPWLPSTKCASEPCKPVNDSLHENTFTVADARHLHGLNYNLVRLGVVWAGGQPTAEPKLGADFLERLHDILSLCDDHGLHVVLDVHQDAVGTAVCGEGVPQWFSALATPGEIGKPLRPSFQQKDGSCGTNDTASWAEYAGDPDYNIKNKCCRLLNQGTWGQLSFAEQSQKTMEYLLSPKGRPHYARYAGLLAAAAKDHPSVVGIELSESLCPTSSNHVAMRLLHTTTPPDWLCACTESAVCATSLLALDTCRRLCCVVNEPPTINRLGLFILWEECYKAIRAVSATLAVGVMDPSQASIGL